MPTLLTLRHAARLLGVSPGRLYRAMADGRLTASPGGGPGKPTLIGLEALQAFAQREGLQVPEAAEAIERPARPARPEHAARSTDEADATQALEAVAGQALAQLMARQSAYMDVFLREELGHLIARVLERVVDPLAERLVERLARAERPERSERPEASADADLLALLQALLPQPRYLRDLGIATFPLARLNARLAPLGYVIEAKKVRDRARFVACTDAHGQVEPFGLFTLRAVAIERSERPEHAERLERVERSEHLARAARAERSERAEVLARLRTMQADGLSLQAIADRLNAEGVTTLSGTERWQKGTVGKLLAQTEELTG